jgi:hypothetical protein
MRTFKAFSASCFRSLNVIFLHTFLSRIVKFPPIPLLSYRSGNNKNNLLYLTQPNLAKICFLQSRAIVQSNPSLFGSGNQRATSIIYSVALK